MRALARGVGRYAFRFFLFYWVCFTFPFPLDLLGLPFGLVEPKEQPAWMKAAGEAFNGAYGWIGKQKDEACKWVGDRLLKNGQFAALSQRRFSGIRKRAGTGSLNTRS